MLKRVGVRASPIVFKFYCLLTSQTAMEKKKSPSSRVPHFYFQNKICLNNSGTMWTMTDDDERVGRERRPSAIAADRVPDEVRGGRPGRRL